MKCAENKSIQNRLKQLNHLRHDQSQLEAAKQACLLLLKEESLTRDQQSEVYRYLAKISRDQGHEAMMNHYIAEGLNHAKEGSSVESMLWLFQAEEFYAHNDIEAMLEKSLKLVNRNKHSYAKAKACLLLGSNKFTDRQHRREDWYCEALDLLGPFGSTSLTL